MRQLVPLYKKKQTAKATICIDNMQCLLGEEVNAEMVLNDFGKIIQHELIKSVDIRKELQLGEFVVMPNHIHAIVICSRV